MANKQIKIQAIGLFLLVLANFIAQIPYYLHLYYNPGNPLALWRGVLLMGCVFAVFLLASILFFKRRAIGYWLLLGFLSVDFLFYLWNTVGEVVHGYGLFFHLASPDPILRIVFAVGYINLFACGYFVGLLLLKRKSFLAARSEEGLSSSGLVV